MQVSYVRTVFFFRLKYSPPSANFAGQSYIHGSVGSALGAFAVSLLGCIYTRVWQGYAFAAMVPGILFLVPSGLTAAGGLAQNYGTGDDQFSSGLSTGLAMIECELVFLHFCPPLSSVTDLFIFSQ